MSKIILFDGECHICDSSVQFILKRDHRKRFSFASLQSEIGHRLLEKHKLDNQLDSMVLIDEGNVFLKSSAVLRTAKYLNRLWRFAYIFIVIPAPLRDIFYNIIATYRYKWFGRKESCEIPSLELKTRFLK